MNDLFGEVIYAYTRKQAVEDGFQVLAPDTECKAAGIKYPVFINRTVWDKYVVVPKIMDGWQDESGRLWDILFMFTLAAKRIQGNTLLFKLFVQNTKAKPREITLKAVIGPNDIDNPQPAITIMLPDED
jgi:hypothetical protein